MNFTCADFTRVVVWIRKIFFAVLSTQRLNAPLFHCYRKTKMSAEQQWKEEGVSLSLYNFRFSAVRISIYICCWQRKSYRTKQILGRLHRIYISIYYIISILLTLVLQVWQWTSAVVCFTWNHQKKRQSGVHIPEYRRGRSAHAHRVKTRLRHSNQVHCRQRTIPPGQSKA